MPTSRLCDCCLFTPRCTKPVTLLCSGGSTARSLGYAGLLEGRVNSTPLWPCPLLSVVDPADDGHHRECLSSLLPAPTPTLTATAGAELSASLIPKLFEFQTTYYSIMIWIPDHSYYPHSQTSTPFPDYTTGINCNIHIEIVAVSD